MATVQISAELTQEKILEAIEQFSPTEMEEFVLKINTMRAQHSTPHLSKRETALLKQINEGIAKEISRPLQKLRAKLEAGTLTKNEHKALLHLVDEVEKFGAKRMTWLIELAQLKRLN